MPIGPHITDFVSFPLKCVIDLVPINESNDAVRLRSERRAYLVERDYRVCEVKVETVERNLETTLDDLFAGLPQVR